MENEIVGYLVAQNQAEQNKFYINSIHVLKDFQKMGIGKKLLEAATKKAMELGYGKIWLDVMTENERTVKWYYNQNFIKHGRSTYQMGNNKSEILIMYKVI